MSELLTLAGANAARLLYLAFPALLGALVGRSGLLGDNERAVGVLNTYALYIGFPALVFRGVADDSFALPESLAFWLVVPVSHLLVVGLIGLFGRHHSHAGTLALVGLFGNVAYLGLPLVIGLYGDDIAGAAALIVAIHVAISVTLGPYLLRVWSGESADIDVGSIARLPLLWAPFVGLTMRFAPENVRGPVEMAISPIADSAAPVALFLLGLYVYVKSRVIFGKVDGATSHIATRLILVPAITAAVAFGAVSLDALSVEHARLFVVLAGMPAAITTFSIAHDAEIGSERVAVTIVRTTLLALVWLPILATIVSL